MSSATPIIRSSLRQGLRTRAAVVPRTTIRYQSTQANTSAGTSHVLSGVAGGVAVLVAGYGLYSYSAAGRMHSKLNKTSKQLDNYYNEATKQFKQSTPNADQAIEYLKNYAYTYAAFIPGGRGYVDTAFKDLDTIRKDHQDEVDSILKDTYTELQQAAKAGANTDGLQKAYSAFETFSKRMGGLVGDAFTSVLDNHPDLKEKVGGNLDQLKQMGDRYGPEAKKQVDETWKQVQDIMKSGFSADTVNKVRKLIDEKVQQVQQMGDKMWKEGMEQAKPYLDKNPKIKEMIEKNQDALKQGNFMELFNKVKSGNMEELQGYVDQAKDKAQKSMGSGGGLDQYIKMIPGGSEILPKLTQLKEVAEKHRGEGESLLKETMDKIHEVVSQQSKKAQDLAEKAKRDAK